MQHTHVKRKEYPMNRYSIEEFYTDPSLRRRLFEDAHRERALAVKAGLSWLWKQVQGLLPRNHGRPGRWIARLG
jgi:hypothetical protein